MRVQARASLSLVFLVPPDRSLQRLLARARWLVDAIYPGAVQRRVDCCSGCSRNEKREKRVAACTSARPTSLAGTFYGSGSPNMVTAGPHLDGGLTVAIVDEASSSLHRPRSSSQFRFYNANYTVTATRSRSVTGHVYAPLYLLICKYTSVHWTSFAIKKKKILSIRQFLRELATRWRVDDYIWQCWEQVHDKWSISKSAVSPRGDCTHFFFLRVNAIKRSVGRNEYAWPFLMYLTTIHIEQCATHQSTCNYRLQTGLLNLPKIARDI